jgi:hypothetical protein
MSFASLLRFWAVAASRNSSRAPLGARRRRGLDQQIVGGGGLARPALGFCATVTPSPSGSVALSGWTTLKKGKTKTKRTIVLQAPVWWG